MQLNNEQISILQECKMSEVKIPLNNMMHDEDEDEKGESLEIMDSQV